MMRPMAILLGEGAIADFSSLRRCYLRRKKLGWEQTRLGAVAVGAHAAVRLVIGLHGLTTQRAAWSARGHDFGDVAAQRAQLIARGAAGEGGRLRRLLLLATA